MSAKCQSAELQVGTSKLKALCTTDLPGAANTAIGILTDKLWRRFEITAIGGSSSESPYAYAAPVLAPVFVYKNNALEDCSINMIKLYLRNQTSLSQAYSMMAAGFYTRVEAQVKFILLFSPDPFPLQRLTSSTAPRQRSYVS